MAQIQISHVKPNIVTLPQCNHSIDAQHLKSGTVFVKASSLHFEGAWKKHGTYAELLESCTFKVSGECQLRAGEDPYVGHFVVGLAKHHTMGKVKTEKSPPKEESTEDMTCHAPGIMVPIAMGLCDDAYVKFSLTSAEPYWKLQKGLIIYGVTFTPMEME